MKRLAAITLCAATAFAGTASIVTSFISPCPSGVYGIDYYDGHIFHINADLGLIYETTMAGNVIKTVRTGRKSFDLDRTAGEFWLADRDTKIIARLTTTGSLISTFAAPGPYGCGVTRGGASLWYSNGDDVFRLNQAGSIMDSFAAPAPTATGLFWEAPYIWIAGGGSNLYQVTTTGSVVDYFTTPTYAIGITRGGGATWFTAGLYVYQARLCYAPVAPASLGRVKALYR